MTLRATLATVVLMFSTSVFSAVTINVPDEIKIEGLNGQELKGRLFGSDNQYKLDAGENIISVRYIQYFEEHPGIGSHDIVRSGVVNIKTPILQDQQSYHLALINPPQNNDEAKSYAKQPVFGLYNANNQLLVEQKGSKTQNTGILQNLFNDSSTDLAQSKSTVKQPAATYTSQAIVATTEMTKPKDLSSTNHASQLIDAWKNASKAERRAFLSWLAEQAK